MYIIFQWGNELTAKQKKALLKKKSLKHEQLFQLMRMRRIDAQRVKQNQELALGKMEPASGKQGGEWMNKVSSVRNRLTGKKRDSKERWNRFAGTSDGGGRGL